MVFFQGKVGKSNVAKFLKKLQTSPWCTRAERSSPPGLRTSTHRRSVNEKKISFGLFLFGSRGNQRMSQLGCLFFFLSFLPWTSEATPEAAEAAVVAAGRLHWLDIEKGYFQSFFGGSIVFYVYYFHLLGSRLPGRLLLLQGTHVFLSII